jgi:hypothetical protein
MGLNATGMRKAAFLCLSTSVAVSAWAMDQADLSTSSMIEVVPPILMLSPDIADSQSILTAQLINRSTHRLHVVSSPPGCHCMVQSVTPADLEPGGVGEVAVIYDFRGDVGMVDRQLSVLASYEGREGTTTIPFQVRGRIPSGIDCSPRAVVWYTGAAPESRTIRVTPRSGYRISDLHVALPPTSGVISATVEPLPTESALLITLTPASTGTPSEINADPKQWNRSFRVEYTIADTQTTKYEYLLAVVSPYSSP